MIIHVVPLLHQPTWALIYFGNGNRQKLLLMKNLCFRLGNKEKRDDYKHQIILIRADIVFTLVVVS